MNGKIEMELKRNHRRRKRGFGERKFVAALV
jgi:hypothetical protein